MSSLFAELPYLLWRPFALLAQVPLFGVFRFLEFITSGLNSLFPTQYLEGNIGVFPVWGVVYTIVFTSVFAFAVTTVMELVLRVIGFQRQRQRRKKKRFQLSFQQWFLLWLLIWFGVLGVGRILSPVWSDLFLSESLVGLYFAGFAFGVVAIVRYLILTAVNLGVRISAQKIKFPQWSKTMGRAGLIFLAVYPILALIGVIAWFRYETNPGGSQFHVLHAAIKNTCLIDAARENCPQTLEELSYIEPAAFARAQEFTQMQYQYDAETNQYSLVIRYNPQRAVVFDQRLHAVYGLDFHEYSVALLGTDRLKEAPAWSGPWMFPDWDY
ncbi:hypothetical protein LRY65_05695 [Candidatus Woesebacteria bacterium]|nr:hypothetical protein [Candidatus Woesebacteria bacterium]MCD8506753.1 hypothetical protein [Candidatus Woesebacteria bacterium]MCD8527660.1 hypothetical protein [Candidatus Woesebacteria bacterium]MCD8546370.1 hypothetical protein [Candidatus Woesebacteria bacterium]